MIDLDNIMMILDNATTRRLLCNALSALVGKLTAAPVKQLPMSKSLRQDWKSTVKSVVASYAGRKVARPG